MDITTIATTVAQVFQIAVIVTTLLLAAGSIGSAIFQVIVFAAELISDYLPVRQREVKQWNRDCHNFFYPLEEGH